MGRKVLICDDDPFVVRLVQVNFQRKGHTVLSASDGREGLEMIRAEQPHLVLLDVIMPEMDGFEVLKTIRSEPKNDDMFVVMLTARAQDKDVYEAYHAGADMFLSKPFNPQELVALI